MIDYTKDILYVQDYFFNGSVIEYDIRAAGYSILKANHALTDQQTQELERMTKDSRVVSIGMMIRDNPELQNIISQGLIQARKEFIKQNTLSEADIICVKKDAIFTTKRCKILTFPGTNMDGVQFREKTKWRSYVKLGRIEFLFQDKDKWKITGLGETAIEYHRDGWIKSIMEVISRISNADRSARTYMNNLVMKYKREQLSERYYHVFKSDTTAVDPMYNYTNLVIPLMQIICRVVV